jgi:hypothetical protein
LFSCGRKPKPEVSDAPDPRPSRLYSSQISKAAFSFQLSAFALLPLAFAASPKDAHGPQALLYVAES